MAMAERREVLHRKPDAFLIVATHERHREIVGASVQQHNRYLGGEQRL